MKLTSKDCANFLNLELHGLITELDKAGNLYDKGDGLVKFVTKYDDAVLQFLNENPNSFIVAHKDYAGKLIVPHVLCDKPRLEFCKLVNEYFKKLTFGKIEPTAYIGKNVTIGKNVYIGHNVVVEDNVVIGPNSEIMPNVVISSNVRIGSNCLIKSGSVIGQKGFGFERDIDGTPVEFTHFGSVIIGNNVEIGALNTIVAGALSNTEIEDHTKLDDHVHIAHNVNIGWGTLIAACAEISGSVKINQCAWIGPNSSIMDKIEIGKKSLIGLGSVVTKSFGDGVVVAGNPGKKLRCVD